MRAANMQALTGDIQGEHPGVTVYGIGDRAHAQSTSDHNEDDTPGVKAEQSDADTKREHRAIDVMIGSRFTKAQADALVARLLADPAALARLAYIIWNGYIWSRKNGWVRRAYTGSNKHTDHVHISGLAADDENSAGWPAVSGGTDNVFAAFGQTNPNVNALQRLIVLAGGQVGVINGQPDYDSNYGPNTANGLKAVLGYGDGKTYGPREYADLLVKLLKKQVPAGQKGDKGDDGIKGDKGDAAVLAPGMVLTVGEPRPAALQRAIDFVNDQDADEALSAFQSYAS